VNPSSSNIYAVPTQFTVNLHGEVIQVISKPGLPDWDQLPPSTKLLAEYALIKPTDQILLYGCHHGALGVFLARHLQSGRLSIADHNYITLEMTRLTLEANAPSQSDLNRVNLITDVDLPGLGQPTYHSVLMQLPKGRALTRRWLLQSYTALREEGNLYVAGSNKAGIQSAINDALELFGNGRILGYKKGNRIAQLIKKPGNLTLPDWAFSPGIAPGTWFEFSISFVGQTYTIHSLPGVFSYDHLDAATDMLIESVKIIPGMRVLDVGCGDGIIGLFAAAQGAAWVDLIDSDFLATASAKETLSINKINNANVLTGDLLNPVKANKYDLILSNPPFHSGHSVDLLITGAMIKQANDALAPNGQFTLVANRFLPYDHLIKEVFGNITCLAKSSKFYVLSGLK
jgi:16S rRNA (guanine1207-N2)-methyltransferase